jgi:hypothetical protein
MEDAEAVSDGTGRALTSALGDALAVLFPWAVVLSLFLGFYAIEREVSANDEREYRQACVAHDGTVRGVGSQDLDDVGLFDMIDNAECVGADKRFTDYGPR